jgi:hypothetical protein
MYWRNIRIHACIQPPVNRARCMRADEVIDSG